jgi:hypothetical protein
MPLNLADYETKAREAVKVFWGNRAAAVQKQQELGRSDQGERAGVTSGKNMDGFMALIQDVIRANGLTDAHMMVGRKVLTLPGFFRPTKLWDLLIINHEGAFGEAARPYVGWMMLVEDAPGSRSPVHDSTPHFDVFPDFKSASYLERYNIFCRKLTQERLYTTATIMASPRTAANSGE